MSRRIYCLPFILGRMYRLLRRRAGGGRRILSGARDGLTAVGRWTARLFQITSRCLVQLAVIVQRLSHRINDQFLKTRNRWLIKRGNESHPNYDNARPARDKAAQWPRTAATERIRWRSTATTVWWSCPDPWTASRAVLPSFRGRSARRTLVGDNPAKARQRP